MKSVILHWRKGGSDLPRRHPFSACQSWAYMDVTWGGPVPETIDGEDYYSVHEACAVLGVKPATLYAYVSRGRLRSYRQGMRRQRLYRRAEVEGLRRLEPSRGSHIPLADSWVDIH